MIRSRDGFRMAGTTGPSPGRLKVGSACGSIRALLEAQAGCLLPPSHQPIESSPSDRTHQPLPFAKTSAEAEGARFVVTRPRCDLTALAPFVSCAFDTGGAKRRCARRVGSCSLRISSMAAFTSTIASPRTVRASCRRLGASVHLNIVKRPKVKHCPLETEMSRWPPTGTRAWNGASAAASTRFM